MNKLIKQLHISVKRVHVYYGNMHSIVSELAVKLNNAMKWLKITNMVTKEYHGQKFEGNSCRKLLKHSALRSQRQLVKYDLRVLLIMKFNTFVVNFNFLN